MRLAQVVLKAESSPQPLYFTEAVWALADHSVFWLVSRYLRRVAQDIVGLPRLVRERPTIAEQTAARRTHRVQTETMQNS